MNTYPIEVQRTKETLFLFLFGGSMLGIDFNLAGYDPVHDSVGSFFIVMGMLKLLKFEVSSRYLWVLRLILWVHIVNATYAFLTTFYILRWLISPAFMTLLAWALFITSFLYCIALSWLAKRWKLKKSEENWRVAGALFVIVLVSSYTIMPIIFSLILRQFSWRPYLFQSLFLDVNLFWLMQVGFIFLPYLAILLASLLMTREMKTHPTLREILNQDKEEAISN